MTLEDDVGGTLATKDCALLRSAWLLSKAAEDADTDAGFAPPPPPPLPGKLALLVPRENAPVAGNENCFADNEEEEEEEEEEEAGPKKEPIVPLTAMDEC